MIETGSDLNRVLSALAEQLAGAGDTAELVVVGGSALVALGLVARATRDVDVVARLSEGSLVPADPLPPALDRARGRVALDFDLPANWLNSGPSGLLQFGLPEGFEDLACHRALTGRH